VFIVGVKAKKHQLKRAMKKLYYSDVAKVNTLIWPDGEKKACVQLTPDCDALDVAKKIGIIQTESSWQIPNIHFFTIKKETKNRAGGVAQVVEYLPSKCKALSSNPSTARNK
jgi:ribosomal protein L23